VVEDADKTMKESEDDEDFEVDSMDEREAELLGDWFARVAEAAADEKPTVRRILTTAEALLAAKFHEAAVVSSFTAMEVFVRQVIVRSIFGALAWPFAELEALLTDSMFGRNGKFDNFRRLTTTIDAPFGDLPDSLWQELMRTQKLRNDVVHGGVDVSEEDARQALDSVKGAIDWMLSVIGDMIQDDSSEA
jgi:hypothetical protein